MPAVEQPAWVNLVVQMDGQGGGAALALGERLPENGNAIWLNLDYTCEEARQWLAAQSRVPEAVRDALFAQDTRPRVTEVGGGLLVYLRGVNLYPDARPEDMIAIRLWVANGLVISTQKRQLASVTELRDSLLRGEGPGDALQLLARLADSLTWRLEDVIGGIEEQVGICSDALERTPDRTLTHAISSVRRRAIALRRYLAPQREALNRLQADKRLSPDDSRLIHEAAERLQRLVEDLDAARDQATLLQEEVFAIQNETTNDRMYLLAVISAVFLPLTFLTGLFGINIGGMPGVDNPAAFWWFVVFLVVVSLPLPLWMAQRRWFGNRAGKAVRSGRLRVRSDSGRAVARLLRRSRVRRGDGRPDGRRERRPGRSR